MSGATELCGGELLFGIEGGVATLTLNRPQSANALTPDQRDTIVSLLQRCDEDREVRVILLRANGRHFCAGADLTVSVPDRQPDAAVDSPTGMAAGTVVKALAYGAHRLVVALLDCHKPVVAAVQGTAAGLGVQILLASDIVVMSEEASFVESFAERGLVPDGAAAYLLVRLVGLMRAKELLLLGGRISAEKAGRYGLVTDVVPSDELETRVGGLVEQLAAGPTFALGMAKRLANRALDSDRASALFEEAVAAEIASATADTREGIAAFVERRSPSYRGY